MDNYVIYTDSACDVSPELLKAWGVYSSSLTFHFDGEEKDYSSEEMTSSEFYGKMRAGGIARTSAVNMSVFQSEFEKLLQQGQDILYLGFASALSATFNSAAMAAQHLRDLYPERKIITLDTRCVSAGQALLVFQTVEKKNSGASLEDAAAFAEELKDRVCHWITVDDLVYLKRGGRISPTTALVGKALGFKPLIRIDDKGKLESSGKVRGRKKAIAALADKYTALAAQPGSSVFITHSECLEEAQALAQLLKERHNVQAQLIADISPVIGAHIGPGGIVFSFVGRKR